MIKVVFIILAVIAACAVWVALVEFILPNGFYVLNPLMGMFFGALGMLYYVGTEL